MFSFVVTVSCVVSCCIPKKIPCIVHTIVYILLSDEIQALD